MWDQSDDGFCALCIYECVLWDPIMDHTLTFINVETSQERCTLSAGKLGYDELRTLAKNNVYRVNADPAQYQIISYTVYNGTLVCIGHLGRLMGDLPTLADLKPRRRRAPSLKMGRDVA